MIGLIVPSAYAEQIKNDFFKFQVEVPYEWTDQYSPMGVEDSTIRGHPSLEISSPICIYDENGSKLCRHDKGVRMIVTKDVIYPIDGDGTLKYSCLNNLRSLSPVYMIEEFFCDSSTIQGRDCPEFGGCYEEVTIPYKIKISQQTPQIKYLKIVYWEAYANNVFFIYDSEVDFDHRTVMSTFKPYSEKAAKDASEKAAKDASEKAAKDARESALSKGEIIDNDENLSINKITIHSKDKKDLLVLDVTVIPYSSGTISFNHFQLHSANDHGQDWKELNNILTEDLEFFGTVVKGSTDWSVNCPSYVGQPVNADVPKDLLLCYEISKKMNIFRLDDVEFSRAAAEKDPISSLIQSNPSSTSNNNSSSEGGGCLIATATYGSEMAPQVQFLREIRDGTVMSTESGTAFMTGFNQFYYSFSPAVADLERENPVFKETVKVALTPMLTSLTLLNHVNVDTEEEMLGYGIGIILLNVGMYFVAPAILVISVKKVIFERSPK